MVQKTIMLFLVLCLVMFSSNFVESESIGTFQIEKDLQIYQECNNCTYCNFTRVKYPNGTNFLSNIEATEDGTYYYSDILGPNLTEVGTYSYCYSCGNEAEKATGCIEFDLTYNGHELNTERSILYMGFIAFLIFILVSILYINYNLPTDVRDEEGVILSLSQTAYIRPILYALAWGILLGIVFLTSNVAIAYLPFAMFGNFLFMTFKLMFIITIVAIPVWFVYLFVGIFKHQEMKRLMERGVEFGGKF